MSRWGKTGRVALVGEVLPWVQVDGVAVGWLYTPDLDYSGWGPRTNEGYVDEHLPSRDEAVMWVLRRARPDVWREERGAWLVRKRKPGEGIADAYGRGGQRKFNSTYPWLIVDPSGVSRDACVTMEGAHRYAARYANRTPR